MGNAAASLPYAIGKQVSTVNDGWALHQGHRKSDNAEVTVFVAKKPALSKTPVDKRSPHMMQLQPALHHFHHCKRLRHPHILQVYATLDTDNPTEANASAGPPSTKTETGDLIVVTEPCITLEAWLQTQPPPEQLAWGLECVVRALHFMHTSANLSHGNVTPGSLVVTLAGDVKLWNFSLVTPASTEPSGGISLHFKDWESLLTPAPYRSPERQEKRWDAIVASGVHTMDSFSMGVLIEHFFNGQLPAPLVKAVQRMQTANLKMRPRLQPLLKCPVFDTPFQRIQLQLEEFTVQPVEQKISFWHNVTPTMQAGLLPECVSVHKLLPLIKLSVQTICSSDSMRSQDMYRREVLSTIQPMFFIAETHLGEKTNQEIGPMVATLFNVNDRAIRGTLLQKVAFLAQCLDNNLLNQSVFEPACSGFSDSSSTLRELTLKATLELVPKLTQPNLEKLSRYLVRLQSDSEASIRTNTVIVFSKLAPHLTETSRQKMLLSAFIRAMKDPFVPCRLSALKCTLKAKEFFTPIEIATRVLPAVTPHLLDGVKDVRREAFVVVDDLLFALRQESERMANQQQEVAATTTSPTNATAPAVTKPVSGGSSQPVAVAPAPASAGYLSGISSWMTSSKPAEPSPTATGPMTVQPPPPVPSVGVHAGPTNTGTFAPAMGSMSLQDIDVSDGWGDDDVDLGMTDIKTDVSPVSSAKLLFTAPPAGEDDFFNTFQSMPARPAGVAAAKTNSGGRLAIPTAKKTTAPVKPIAPVVKKLAVDDSEDGWDDF